MASIKKEAFYAPSYSHDEVKLVLEVFTINTDIEKNTTIERANLYGERFANGSVQSFNGSSTAEVIVNNNKETKQVAFDYRPSAGLGKKNLITSWDTLVQHNDEGNATIEVSAKHITGVSLGTATIPKFEYVCDTIARASKIRAVNKYIEENVDITIERYSSAFTHTLTYKFGSLTGTIAIKTSELSITNWKIPTTFYSQIPNSPSGTCEITCTTYSEDTIIGKPAKTTFVATANKELSKPNINGNVKDINEKTIALTGDFLKIVKGHSTALVSVEVEAKNGSNISTMQINDTYFNTPTVTIPNAKDSKFTIKIVDTRNYSNEKVVGFTDRLINYIPLTMAYSIYKPTQTDNKMLIKFSGNYFNQNFGQADNQLDIKLQVKNDEGTFVDVKTFVKDTDFTIENNVYYSKGISRNTEAQPVEIVNPLSESGWDYKKSYEFKIIATDKLETFENIRQVQKGESVLDIYEKDNVNYFNVNGNIIQNNQRILDYDIIDVW